MGDLVSGDSVFDEKGLPTRVMAAFDVMYHHTCYEVVFSDGSSIVADAEHEWASYTTIDRSWAKRPQTSVYAAKNFVTSDQLIMIDRLINLSQNDDTLTIKGAIDLIGGHQWSVFQAASKIAPVNSKERPIRYRCQTLLTATRDRLARDLSEQCRDGRAYTLVTTERMATTLKVGAAARINHAILVADPLMLPDANLPIDPYFLGIWLGDGSSYSNEITTADPDLIPEIEKAGYTVRSLMSNPYKYAVDDENGKAVSRWQPGMTGRLRALGLLLNKHIPTTYLRASEQQRRALLAGLLDTDGTVSRYGSVEFTTTNPQLAQDVYELVSSLGFRPSLRGGRSRYNGKDCGPKWTLSFTTNVPVFRLGRKVVAHKERLRNYNPERNRFRYVIAVREVPSRPVRCIQVESPGHLYLAGKSMIPTHNSLAYLLPIVRSGKVAIISTANKALQEQLFYKDIPFVQEHIQDFEAALVKGMGNYICLDRMEKERIETQPLLKNPDFTRLMNIVKEFELNITGDFETLGFTLPNDIRSRINADSDQCAWRECPFFAKCYVRQMRDRAALSQVIIVNHTLLLLDAALDGYLLPKHDVIVVDEAHHLEDEATRALTVTVSESKIAALLAQKRLKQHSRADLQEEAKQTMKFAWDRLEYITHTAYQKGRVILQEPLQEGLRLATIIAKLAESLREQRPEYMEDPENSLYDKLLTRTVNLSEAIRKVFAVDQCDNYVYYIEEETKFGRRGSNLAVHATPLDVNSLLRELLFNESKVICTSATLATVGPNPVDPEDRRPNFTYFRSRVGLDHTEYPDVLEHILPYTFDYENNALLYLPRHLPEPVYGPDTHYYTNKIAEEMMRLVEASQGRAFLLFSSKRMLDAVYNIFLDSLPTYLDFRLLRQGDMNRIELLREFRASESAILFGLKSFWEGVDIAGETLSLVVIDKMPFDPPDDPVHEARVARMKASKENWFGNYVLPQAVLRLKQGLGRLLRTHEDRGVMAILDTRLHTKRYGKLVINALPPARRTEQLKNVEHFFETYDDTPF
jgi:Rad3-related DNA helicase